VIDTTNNKYIRGPPAKYATFSIGVDVAGSTVDPAIDVLSSPRLDADCEKYDAHPSHPYCGSTFKNLTMGNSILPVPSHTIAEE